MLFRRRKKASWPDRVREFFWPRKGFTRQARYLAKRILRLSASPHAVAAGVAAGTFSAFTPLLGFHAILALALAYLTAGNLLAAQALVAQLSASGVLQASSELTRILALQIVFTTTCWLSFERFMPGRDGRDTDPGLAAFYTLTLISPYISGESRAYLDYLKSKYLG